MSEFTEAVEKARQLGLTEEEVFDLIESTMEGAFDEALRACTEAINESVGRS